MAATTVLSPALRKLSLSARLTLRAEFAWYRDLQEDDRALVHTMIDSALAQFSSWFTQYTKHPDQHPQLQVGTIFTLGSVQLTEHISLQQTLDLTRFFVDFLELHLDGFTLPSQQQYAREAMAIFAKEIAFAAAQVYANAAQTKHIRQTDNWQEVHTRVLQTLIKQSLDLHALQSQAVQHTLAQLYWDTTMPSTAFIAALDAHVTLNTIKVAIEQDGGQCILALLDALDTSSLPDYLQMAQLTDSRDQQAQYFIGVVSGSTKQLADMMNHALTCCTTHTVCVGSTGVDAVALVRSLHEVCSTARTLHALMEPEHIVYAHMMLPERALLGDDLAKQQLIHTVFEVLVEQGNDDPIANTVTTFLRAGSSLEATAQLLHVHPNTVRYRLKRSAELTGWDPLIPRDAYVLTTALSLGLMQYSASNARLTKI